jgi:hypothetical protein
LQFTQERCLIKLKGDFMGEVSSDLPPPITPEELGELYDVICAHPIGVFGLLGVTREEYIERQGQIGSVRITDPGEAAVILFLATGKVPGADRLGEETEPVIEHWYKLRGTSANTQPETPPIE